MRYTPYTVNCLFIILIMLATGCGRDGLTRLIPCVENTDCGRGLCVEGFCDNGNEGLTSASEIDSGHDGDAMGGDASHTGDTSEGDVGDFDVSTEDVGHFDISTGDVVETIDSGSVEDISGNDDVVFREDVIPAEDLHSEDFLDSGTGTDASDSNPCGGTQILEGEPGTACDADCGEGIWECVSENSVECVSDRPLNDCGGCTILDDSPGDPCTCEGDGGWGNNEEGFLECDGPNDLVCECDEPVAPIADGTCDAPFSLSFSGVGSMTVEHDLCDGDDNLDIGETDDCGDIGLPGNDFVYEFSLTDGREIYVELFDDDGGTAIDTVVSIRTDCEDEDSQFVCSDDMLCTDENEDLGACVGDLQPRQSILTSSLDAGTYYIVIDSYEYDSEDFGFDGPTWACGDVSMVVVVE